MVEGTTLRPAGATDGGGLTLAQLVERVIRQSWSADTDDRRSTSTRPAITSTANTTSATRLLRLTGAIAFGFVLFEILVLLVTAGHGASP